MNTVDKARIELIQYIRDNHLEIFEILSCENIDYDADLAKYPFDIHYLKCFLGISDNYNFYLKDHYTTILMELKKNEYMLLEKIILDRL